MDTTLEHTMNDGFPTFDFADNPAVNARHFARVGRCQRIEHLADGRIRIAFEGENVSAAWMRTLHVTAIASLDGHCVYYAPVEQAYDEDGLMVIVTYPASQSDTRADSLAETLAPARWSGYLVARTDSHPFRAPASI